MRRDVLVALRFAAALSAGMWSTADFVQRGAPASLACGFAWVVLAFAWLEGRRP